MGFDFRTIANRNLRNETLRNNLRFSLQQSREKRQKQIDLIPDWEEKRKSAAGIRQKVLENLAVNLDQFSKNAEASGVEVIWAENAVQAREAVLHIIKKHNAQSIVKSKSMLTEEIELNSFLEAEDLTVIETDLGEFIAQLADQKPSHITAPIIHMSRQEVGRIFQKNLGTDYSEMPEDLTQIARLYLRQKFLDADIGISGVNFGIVDSGSLVIVENEGNVRLSTSLPPVHIALMGIERLLPSAEPLPMFLRMLAISATGQFVTNYVSILNGPRRKHEVDGPEKLYLVLVDNGRSRIAGMEKYSSILTCIRCGACMNSCPVYERVGGHAYGSIYPGPLGAVLSPLLFSTNKYWMLPFASTLCGECSEVCPVKIPLHHLLLELRADAVAAHHKKRNEQLAFSTWAYLLGNPARYRKTERLLRMVEPLLKLGSPFPRIPVWSKTRDFPPLAKNSFHDLFSKEKEKNE